MHSANAIHTEGPSFEFASSEPLFAENVRPQPLHARLWAPSASRPFLTNAGHPHRGQPSGSSGKPAISSAIATLRSASSSSFSSCESCSMNCDTMLFTALPFFDGFQANPS